MSILTKVNVMKDHSYKDFHIHMYYDCVACMPITCSGKFSWMVNLYHFVDLIFTGARTHSHYVQYNRACLVA